MLNYSAIKTAIYSWITSQASGWTVIRAEQTGPRPTSPYITYRLSNTSSVHDDWRSAPKPGTPIIETIVGNREMIVEVRAFRDGAMAIIEKLRTSVEKQTVHDSLLSNGIVFVNHMSPNQNLTSLYDSEFTEVFGSDIRFRTSSVDTDESNYIETVEITEKYRDDTGTIVVQNTYEITT